MRTWILMLLAVALAAPLVHGRENLAGRGAFKLEFDAARFFGDEKQGYLEIYYGVPQSILSYVKSGDQYIGAVAMRFQVHSDTGLVSSKDWKIQHAIADSTEMTNGKVLLGVDAVGLPFGEYTISLTAFDINDASRKDSIAAPIAIRETVRDRESLSDIELCSSIQQSTNKESNFFKNTLEVIPNASRLYGSGLPILYYYAEAYNLLQPGADSSFTVHASVIDALGKEASVSKKTKRRLYDSSVEVGTINVSGFKGGSYTLRVSVEGSAGNVLATSAKRFFVYKPGEIAEHADVPAISDVSTSEYAVMKDAEIEQEFEYVRYIITDAERRQFQRLTDLKAKQSFLYEFWKRRDPDPSTSRNEAKEDYMQRVNYTIQSLSTNFRKGWRTDRGRVYIVYGPPDEIERSPNSSESNPYEIWSYHALQGGVVFAFVDRNGLGDYTLVHSTHRNELRDDNWFQAYAQKTR
jgi:GWxTD domain-containing protein